jgi:transcriptional regulator with GAF, ATPase, and Fis domain
VLLQGETGVGKGLVARAIHDRSGRAGEPFVSVNCAALAPTLIESELFGHEKGAFTGADGERRGRFEMADGGTLVLDEIGELPIGLQAKLLGVLESGEFERVGGSTRRLADVRVIASTNRDLRREVDRGTFRRDLFYRLEVYPITIPPLRERTEDIPALAAHFVRRACKLRGTRVDEIPAEVLRHLEGYDWPGNVRELQNVIERAVLLRPEDRVLRLASPLPGAAIGEASDPPSNTARDEDGRIPTLDDVERRHIEEVLRLCGGQIAGPGGAATILGLNPSTLRSRMAKLGLQRSSRSTGPGPSPPLGRDISS